MVGTGLGWMQTTGRAFHPVPLHGTVFASRVHTYDKIGYVLASARYATYFLRHQTKLRIQSLGCVLRQRILQTSKHGCCTHSAPLRGASLPAPGRRQPRPLVRARRIEGSLEGLRTPRYT